MNEPKIANALTCVDEDLITEAMEAAPCQKRRPILRWGILAACLALLIGTITVAATTDWGTKLLNTFTGETRPGSDLVESGYTLRIPIERVPLSSLTGEIREVPAIILKQIENHQLWSSQLPNNYMRKFTTPEEARKFIGLDQLQLPDLNLQEPYTSFSALGDGQTGNILTFTLEIFYRCGNMNIQSRTIVYTELWDSDLAYHRSISNQELTFKESFYTTASGLKCHIIANSPLESGYQGMCGFLVYEGILYELNISYRAEDSAAAEEILHQWADQFGN